jgi:hypothetical protein
MFFKKRKIKIPFATIHDTPVSKEDMLIVKEEFADRVIRDFLGDGVCLADYISITRSWTKKIPFPPKRGVFKRLAEYHYNEEEIKD